MLFHNLHFTTVLCFDTDTFQYLYTTVQKFEFAKIFWYLSKKLEKLYYCNICNSIVIVQYILKWIISVKCKYKFSNKMVIYSCDGKAECSAVITTVFSVK